MFCSTFRNTVKTLFRSVTFWLVVLLFAVVVLQYAVIDSVDYGPMGAPEYLLFEEYTSFIDNLINAGSLMYPLAILSVVTTVLVINRNHGDQFFEIEKAAGLKPSLYLLGRLCAVVTLLFAAQWILTFAAMHIYVFRMGGVEGMGTLSYLGDSLFRLTRTNLFLALPYILFYVGVVYLLGTLFKNGIIAAIGGFAYAIAYYVAFLQLRHTIAWETYFEYLCPMPRKLRHFFAYLGLENEEFYFSRYATSFGNAMLCVGFLVGVYVLCSMVSYVLTRKREI